MLLIIFMVIVPLTPHGVATAVPQPAKEPTAPASPPLVLEVRAAPAGGLVATYRVDGAAVEVAELPAALRSRLASRQEPAVLIAGDRSLAYADVAAAVGIARRAGAATIGILNPKDMQTAR